MKLKSYIPKEINEKDAVLIEADLFSSLEIGDDPQAAIQEMYTFFVNKKFDKEVIKPLLPSYWRWYVRIFWQYMHRLDTNTVSQCLHTVLPSGISMGFSCLDLYIQYLSQQHHSIDNKEIISAHKLCASRIRTSIIPLSFETSSQLSLKDVYIDVENKFTRFDTLKKAEYLSKLEYELFEKNSLSVLFDSQQRMSNVQSLLDCLDLFAHIPDVMAVVSRFEKYRDSTLVDPEIVQKVDAARVLRTVSTLTSDLPPADVSILLSDFNIFQFLRADIEKKNTEGIITKIDDMALWRSEPRIRDTYFYNEATGQFEWDEKLLRELELVPKDFDMSKVNKKD